MQMQVLKNELADDPLGRGYSDMSDTEAAASLNAADRAGVQRVSNHQYLVWLAGERRKKIAAAAANHASAAVQGLAQMALDIILRPDVDYVRANHETMLDGLVAGGVLTVDDKAALDDQATATISRAVELELGLVRTGDVTMALRG